MKMRHLLRIKRIQLVVKVKVLGSSKKQTGKTEKSENDDSNKDNLNLSEGEDSADDKQTDATTKKGATKRSAPSSDKKTGATTGKKRSADDEPFEDRTNDDDSADADFNSEDGQSINIDYFVSISQFTFYLKMVHQLNKPEKVLKLHRQPTKTTGRAAKKTKTN